MLNEFVICVFIYYENETFGSLIVIEFNTFLHFDFIHISINVDLIRYSICSDTFRLSDEFDIFKIMRAVELGKKRVDS